MARLDVLFKLVVFGSILLGDAGTHAFQFNSFHHTIVGKQNSRSAVSIRDRLRCSALDTPITETNDMKLQSGMRISRIITATTTGYDAMLRLGQAKSRNDIMKTCLVRHKRTSTLSEHHQLPMSSDGMHTGWRFEQRAGSPIKASSGAPGSDLWVMDIHSYDTLQVQVGSWLVAKYDFTCRKGIACLFTKTDSRIGNSLQPILLTRPGFANPDLVCTTHGPHFIITYIELQYCNELGTPTRSRY